MTTSGRWRLRSPSLLRAVPVFQLICLFLHECVRIESPKPPCVCSMPCSTISTASTNRGTKQGPLVHRACLFSVFLSPTFVHLPLPDRMSIDRGQRIPNGGPRTCRRSPVLSRRPSPGINALFERAANPFQTQHLMAWLPKEDEEITDHIIAIFLPVFSFPCYNED